MDAVAVFGILKRDSGCYLSAPIPALRVVSVVAQAQHQLTPGARDPFHRPAVLLRFIRKTIAGQRGANHMESVLRFATVAGGIGQGWNDFQEFDDRSGPAMGKDQRRRVRLW